MKYLSLICLFLVACEPKERIVYVEKEVPQKLYLEGDALALQKRGEALDLEVFKKRIELSNASSRLSKVEAELEKLERYGRKYILKIKFKQSRFSLDVNEHIKDAMNSGEFEIPVDRQYYDSLDKGDKIVDDFRVGSLLMSGSFGDWDFTVKDKYIK